MPETPAPQGCDYNSEEMIAELYGDLRRLAAARLSKLPPGQTLQATALLHDAYLRLAGSHNARWQNRAHFFASAAEAMRRILVEQARRKAAARRGAGAVRTPLNEVEVSCPEPDERILAVHEALDALELENPIQAQVVKLRFYGGLKHEEIAALLNISEKTARRHWTLAKICLFEKISSQL
jgi:RNA polymerase sigma factor (TIGR02999 family)